MGFLSRFLFFAAVGGTICGSNGPFCHAEPKDLLVETAVWSPAQIDLEAAKLVQSQKVIRVGFTSAPGFGHQANTVWVMKRIRELGFTGKFEIFYDPDVARKLEYLLPGLKLDGPGIQKLDSVGPIEIAPLLGPFYDKVPPIKYRLSRVPLGVIGGDDSNLKASSLNVKSLVAVQPTGFSPSSLSRGKRKRGGFPLVTEHLPTRIGADSVQTLESVLGQERAQGSKASEKLLGLQALSEKAGHFEILTAYGLGFRGVEKFSRLIQAIKWVQRSSPKAFKGPVVIPLLSSFSPREWASFNEHLSKFLAPTELPTVVASNDPAISLAMDSLHQGDVLVMPVGSVSQDLWHSLVAASTLPPTVAGTSGKNFVRSLGKPYLDTTTHDYFEHRLPLNVQVQASAAHKALTGMGSASSEDLGAYLVASLDPSSDLSREFRRQAESMAELPDKVSTALALAARELGLAEKPRSWKEPESCLSWIFGSLK